MHDQLNAWLLSPDDYSEGLRLLEGVGASRILLSTLKLGEDVFNRSRLEAALRAVVENQKNLLSGSARSRQYSKENSVPLQIGLDYGHTEAQVVVRKILSSAPEILSGVDQLKEQTQELMNERSELKARLRAFADDASKQAQRRDWAFRILAIGDELDDLFSRLDFYEQYGYLAPQDSPEASIDDTAALMNARSYVSRYKAKLRKKTLTAQQRASSEKLLQQYTDEKNRLELKLRLNEK